MRSKVIAAVALFLSLWTLRPAVVAQALPPSAPRLVVLAVVDQMRFDYLTRYKMPLGFGRLQQGGALMTEARYPHAKTETAQGHALMLTGQPAAITGIIGDTWFDRRTRTTITAGESTIHHLVGTTTTGGSPEQMLVHTLGDLMKVRDPKTLVMTASWKRYSAILNGGQHPDVAYWFDAATGHMVTSDYYLHEYPAWVDAFNRTEPTTPYFGKDWMGHKLTTSSTPDTRFRTNIRETPYANDILLAFVKKMLASTALGRDDVPDLLAVSFSDTDYVGHAYGPGSPEVEASFVEVDRQLNELFQALDDTVGKDRWSLAMVADHGAAMPADKVKAEGGDAGILETTPFRAAVRKALAATWPDPDKLVLTMTGAEIYLDLPEAAARKIDTAVLEDKVAEAAKAQPGVLTAYTRRQILAGANTTDPMLAAVVNTFNASLSGDVYVVVKPNYYFGTIHGTLHEYDVHVPLFFYGHNIVAGKYDRHVSTADLAPTLGELVGIKMTGIFGKPIPEVIKR